MTTNDRRRAGRLMQDARAQSVALLNHPELTPRQRAMRTIVFLEEAARLSPKRFSDAEKRHVLREHLAAHVRFGVLAGGA